LRRSIARETDPSGHPDASFRDRWPLWDHAWAVRSGSFVAVAARLAAQGEPT
jgi:hypothetical protein